ALLAFTPLVSLLAGPAPEYSGIDHAELLVSDLDQSLAFYTRLFGTGVWKQGNGQQRYLKLGNSYVVVDAAAQSGVGYASLGIDASSSDSLHSHLQMQDIKWQDDPAGDYLQVNDGDGISTRLAP